MAPRNNVKFLIGKDLVNLFSKTRRRRHGRVPVGRSTVVPVGFSGANSSSLPERSVTTGMPGHVLPTVPPMTLADRATVQSAGTLPSLLAAGVDQALDAGPALTRSNPTAAILGKVPSADALVYEYSMLSKNEMGAWVTDLGPEDIAESDANPR